MGPCFEHGCRDEATLRIGPVWAGGAPWLTCKAHLHDAQRLLAASHVNVENGLIVGRFPDCTCPPALPPPPHQQGCGLVTLRSVEGLTPPRLLAVALRRERDRWTKEIVMPLIEDIGPTPVSTVSRWDETDEQFTARLAVIEPEPPDPADVRACRACSWASPDHGDDWRCRASSFQADQYLVRCRNSQPGEPPPTGCPDFKARVRVDCSTCLFAQGVPGGLAAYRCRRGRSGVMPCEDWTRIGGPRT